MSKNLTDKSYMTRINKSDLVESHSLNKQEARSKENSVAKIEKQPIVKSIPNKSFVPNQKLTKKLNENNQDLYLTTDIIGKTHYTAKNSPLRTNCFRNKSYVSNVKNNSSFNKTILVKEETKKELIEIIISELDQFNNNIAKFPNMQVVNLNQIFQIFEIQNSLDEIKKATYTNTWKKFITNIERVFKMNSNFSTLKQDRFLNRSKQPINAKQTINAYNNISHLNNNNFNFQIVEASNLECERLKKSLDEKDKAIREFKILLENKDKKMKEFENSLMQVNKQTSNKNNYLTNNIELRNLESIDLDQEELEMYQNKQLMRDFKNLSSENKNLREVISNLERDMKVSKEKEMKIMHILYSLKKKGVKVESLISEEFPKELTDISKNLVASRKTSENSETNRSLDNSMYTPICIDSPYNFKKPDKIPSLNLDNINSLYNKDYLSPNNLKDKKNFFPEKNEECVKKEKEIVKEISYNKYVYLIINRNLFNSTKISRDNLKRSDAINATVDASSILFNSPSIQFKTLNENKSNLSSNKIKICNIQNPRISLQMNLKDKISFKERIKNILQKK